MDPHTKFITETIGREIQRACEHYVGSQKIYKDFMARLPEIQNGDRVIRQIDLRFWDGDDLDLDCSRRYGLSHPSGKVLPGPGSMFPETYIPDGELPKSPGLTLQVAVLFFDDGEDRLAVVGDPLWRGNRAGTDAVIGAVLFTQL